METATGERYGFELLGIDATDRAERLGLIEVDVTDDRTVDGLRAQLRPWALAMLDAWGGGCGGEFGHYRAVFATLDADGEPAHPIEEQRLHPADNA
jgi:hypothetical protein